MAKGSGNKGDGRSKIRVVVIEADLAEGELRDVTQAITNALRPTPVVVQRLVTSGATTPAATQLAQAEDIEDAVVIDENEEEVSAPAPKPKAAPRTPKYRSPKVLDVDLDSEVSFASFVAEKNPQNHTKRFLTVAAWFKLHRGTDAITMDHVYTCYRKVKWPSNIDDFDGPLRQLKSRQLMDKEGKGLYAINHLGLSEVDDLGNGNGSE
jgi:hypothetical protein